MFPLSLKQGHFGNQTINFLSPTNPYLYLKKCDSSSQIQQKRPFSWPAAALFRDTYAATSKKSVSTEPKARLFQKLNNKIFRFSI